MVESIDENLELFRPFPPSELPKVDPLRHKAITSYPLKNKTKNKGKIPTASPKSNRFLTRPDLGHRNMDSERTPFPLSEEERNLAMMRQEDRFSSGKLNLDPFAGAGGLDPCDLQGASQLEPGNRCPSFRDSAEKEIEGGTSFVQSGALSRY